MRARSWSSRPGTPAGECARSGGNSQGSEGIAVDAPHRPLVLRTGAERAVEADGVDVPVQDPPLEPRVAALHADRRELLQQRLAEAVPARGRLDEQVLQPQARQALPGGERDVPERESDDP